MSVMQVIKNREVYIFIHVLGHGWVISGQKVGTPKQLLGTNHVLGEEE